MIKFFVEEEAVASSRIYLEDAQDIKHLTRVLRAKCGDAVTVCDGTGWEYETEIEEIEDGCVTLRIVDRQKDATEPLTRVTLFQGVPKAAKMETVIQKTVELGVDCIVPVFTARTVVVEKGNFSKKMTRWQKIADEAVKQCKRGKIPQVEPQLDFDEMCEKLEDYDLILCPYENETGRTLKDCLREACGSLGKDGSNEKNPCERRDVSGASFADNIPPRKIALIIGPEGGFADEEIAKLRALPTPAQIVSLGKIILRTETAGMAALAMIMYEYEL